MARAKSEEKRATILSVATELIADQGLGASTADIAKKAGVPHGSVFTYFKTKAALLVALYTELSAEMTDTVMEAMPSNVDEQAQFRHLWVQWTNWGASNPSKRRTQALLKLSVDREMADAYAAPVFELIEKSCSTGVLRDAPSVYAVELVAAWVETTIDFMIAYPEESDGYCQRGFDAIWHALR